MIIGKSDFVKDTTEKHLPSTTQFDNYLQRWGISEKTLRKSDSHSYDELISLVNTTLFYMNGLGVAVLLLGILGVAVSTGNSGICGIMVGRYCHRLIAVQ